MACSAKNYGISPDETKTLMQDEQAVLIDVRTKEEYDLEHIEGALLIPLDTIEDEIISKLPDKTDHLVIYCRSGNRSQEAIRILKTLGFEFLYDLGGIIDWPYETVRLND